jgi:hypothetical protein
MFIDYFRLVELNYDGTILLPKFHNSGNFSEEINEFKEFFFSSHRPDCENTYRMERVSGTLSLKCFPSGYGAVGVRYVHRLCMSVSEY